MDICVVRSSLYSPQISDHVFLMVTEQNRNVLFYLGCWVERSLPNVNYTEHISMVLL